MKRVFIFFFIVSMFFILRYANAQYDLVGYWSFDDCTAYDFSENVNDGIIYGATCVDGKIGNGLSFDGKDDYVDVGNSSSLNPTEAISVEAWIFAKSYTTYSRIVSKETATIANPYTIELISSTNIKFFIGNGTTEIGTPDINVNLLNNWAHVVGTYDGQYIKIYINGELKGKTPETGDIPLRTTKVLIGNNPLNNRQFNGTIDEVRIYNRALTEEEVYSNYLKGIKYNLYGQLKNKTDNPIQANITLFEQGTSIVSVTNQTDTNGNYIISAYANTYDLQYSILNFFILNFWIKLISFNLNENKRDVVSYVTDYPSENKLSFIIDTKDIQGIHVYSGQRPKRVLLNATNLTEVSSLSELKNGTWYFDSGQMKLYLTKPEIKTVCPFSCCLNEIEYLDKPCNPNYYCSNRTCYPKTVCPYECCIDEEKYLDKPCALGNCTNKICVIRYTFGVVGSVNETPAIANIYALLGNQSISYKILKPSEITNFADIDHFDGLVVWTKPGYTYNATAIKQFAETRIVISHMWDFSNILYPILNRSTKIATNNRITYVKDQGNFHKNDLIEVQNETAVVRTETENINRLTGILATDLSAISSVDQISRFDTSKVAFFQMNSTPKSGFYVMDLDATTSETEWNGIWHLFPAIKIVKDFPTGKYARWMANGASWWDLAWVNNHITTLANENSDIAERWIIGKSLEGRDINAIVIGKGNRYAIIDGAIHGNEKTGTFGSLRLAELLIEYYHSNPFWQLKLNQYKVIIIPVLNPDGFVRNSRFNSRSIVEAEKYNKNGTASVVNGSWVSHGLATTPSGIEERKCTVAPIDPDVDAKVLKTTSTKFQVSLTWKSSGLAVTTPKNISWACFEKCCNLNRQFPPGATTTEPEAWALRSLMGNYTPSIYVNNHVGWCYYPLDLIYGNYLVEPYTSFTISTLKQANKSFAALNHWGIKMCDSTKIPINKVRRIIRGGIDSMAIAYASKYHNISSLITETFASGPRTSLWGLDFYPSILIAYLKHFDNDKSFLFNSNAFITSTSMQGNNLTVTLDTGELTESSTTVIRDMINRGKPTEVRIDGIRKDEGSGWTHSDWTTTVTGAKNLIEIGWI